MTFKRLSKKLNAKTQLRNIVAELDNALVPEVKKRLMLRKSLVTGWKDQPNFQFKRSYRNHSLKYRVVIANNRQKVKGSRTTVGDLWKWKEHTGTRAHTIQPRRAKVLAFITNGKPVFAKKVHHPGYRPAHKTSSGDYRLNRRAKGIIKIAIHRGLNR